MSGAHEKWTAARQAGPRQRLLSASILRAPGLQRGEGDRVGTSDLHAHLCVLAGAKLRPLPASLVSPARSTCCPPCEWSPWPLAPREYTLNPHAYVLTHSPAASLHPRARLLPVWSRRCGETGRRGCQFLPHTGRVPTHARASLPARAGSWHLGQLGDLAGPVAASKDSCLWPTPTRQLTNAPEVQAVVGASWDTQFQLHVRFQTLLPHTWEAEGHRTGGHTAATATAPCSSHS